MGHMNLEEAEVFNPFEDSGDTRVRRRSRGLTYLENEELKKYQKRMGIKSPPIPKTKPQKRPKAKDYPAAPLGRPIGKPTKAPVIGLPNQGGSLYNTTNGPIPQGQPKAPAESWVMLENSAPGVPQSAGQPLQYPQSRAPAPMYAQPSVGPAEATRKKKNPSGLKRWFGFAK